MAVFIHVYDVVELKIKSHTNPYILPLRKHVVNVASLRELKIKAEWKNLDLAKKQNLIEMTCHSMFFF